MDVLDRQYAKKLLEAATSGLVSHTVDNTNKTITFRWNDGTTDVLQFNQPADGLSVASANIDSNGYLILTMSDNSIITCGYVKGEQGEKGDTGDKGEKGDKGEQGIQGEKGEDGVNPTIEIATQSDTEYTLKLTDADGSIITPNLQGIGSAIFVGTEITSKQSSIVVEITDSHIGDMYINVDTSDYYIRDDANSVNNSWCYKGNLQGIQGMNNYELAVKNGFIGTEQDYLDSLVGESNDTHIVSSKPNIADDTTELKTWYYYQIDGSGTGTAWKYKMYLPTTADLTAGKYAVYYSMKPYRGEFTVDTPAMTDKDTYRYYVIMDLDAITTTIYKESIADGTTEVLETVQCEQKEPTDEYIIIDEPMEQLGQWVQTLYIGSTKEDASEVTLTTGTSVTGFISTLTFEEIVGNRSNLLTTDKTSIVNAINEHDKLLRNSNADVLNTTSKNIVGAINELESKHYLDVFNLQGGSVLDYAKTFEALTHNYFYANNCSDLPNNMNYGYCSVDVSQDPLYRDITFYCPTSGRIYVNTIGASADLTGFGEWSGWHEFLMKKDIVTTLDANSTDKQIPSAKAVYDGLESINDFSVQVVTEILDLNDIIETGIYFFAQAYTPVNIPTGVNGWLVVMKGNSSNVVKQVWYRQGTADINSYNTFERYKAGDTWSEWTRFLTEKDYYSALNSGNTSIPENSDLNDYLTAGVYACTDSTVAKTLTNCPHIASNFKLIVNKNRGNSDIFYGYQMIVGTVGGNPVKDVCIYYRGVATSSDGVSAFSKWKIMSGSTVANISNKEITSALDTTKATVNNIRYSVKNGICYVKIDNLRPLVTCNESIILPAGTLPNADGGLCYANINTWNDTTVSSILLQPNEDGSLDLWCNSSSLNKSHYGMFSYPVAE